MRIGERFEKFIQNELVPTKEETEMIKSRLEKLQNMMKNNTNIPIAETIYGGSYAKNTIVKGRREADIVFILSPKYPEKKIDELRSDLKEFFSTIESISAIREQPRALSFNYSGIEIDLLVAKKYSKPKSLANMPKKQQKRYYGASTIYHVRIVKERGSKFQNTVRLLKYWLKRNPQKLCPSFLIELIAAHVYDENEDSSYPELFIEVLKFIIETNLDIFLVFSYNEKGSYSSKVEPEQAIIADPGNPKNNLLDSINNKEQLIAYSKEALEKAKKGKWELIFGDSFPNEEGIVKRRAEHHRRKSHHPPDAPNRRYG
ncbi:MAG: SMODS domain-containing nucleotidyltransferase [Candidatus Heimdallarchaeaceae archaeon]